MPGHTHQKKHNKNTGSKPIDFREPQTSEEYAIIEKDCGGSRFQVTICSSYQTVIATARTRISKGPHKQKLGKGDLVLIQREDCTTLTDKYWILLKYSEDAAKQLHKAGEVVYMKEAEPDTVGVAV
jgi:translation initiation factor IF-1